MKDIPVKEKENYVSPVIEITEFESSETAILTSDQIPFMPI